MPELPISNTSTSAFSEVPDLAYEPWTYECTCRNRASCFAWFSSSRPLHPNPDWASASHNFALVTTNTFVLTSAFTRSRLAPESAMAPAESAGVLHMSGRLSHH